MIESLPKRISVQIFLTEEENELLTAVAAKERRTVYEQAGLFLAEALGYEGEDTEEVDNLLGIKLTLGNLMWLDELAIEDVEYILQKVMPGFKHYCENVRGIKSDD